MTVIMRFHCSFHFAAEGKTLCGQVTNQCVQLKLKLFILYKFIRNSTVTVKVDDLALVSLL